MSDHHLKNVLIYACKHNHKDIVKIVLEKKVDDWRTFKTALSFSCKNGNIEIIEMLMEKILKFDFNFTDVNQDINDKVYCFTAGIYLSNNDTIINLLSKHLDYKKEINEYEKKCYKSLISSYINDPLKNACCSGFFDVINLLLEKKCGDLNNGLKGACKGGHLNIANFLIDKGANDWNGGLKKACKYKHVELVKLMMEKGANDWNTGLRAVYHMGIFSYDNSPEYKCIVDLMLKHGATNLNDLEEEVRELENEHFSHYQ